MKVRFAQSDMLVDKLNYKLLIFFFNFIFQLSILNLQFLDLVS